MKADKFRLFYGLFALLSIVVMGQSYVIYAMKQDQPAQAQNLTQKTAPKSVTNDFFNHFNAQSADPFLQMRKMQEEMQKSFGNFNSMFADDPFFKEAFGQMSSSPLSDIKEDKENFIVELNIPGSKESEIKIIGEGNTLTVLANSEVVIDKKEENYIHKERYTQHFERRFILPDNADITHKTSEYKDGVLKITVPKKG
jgi:HSP20 family protein